MLQEILYSEIAKGFSIGEIITAPERSITFYYRHPKHTELFELEKLTEKSMAEALEMGLFTFDEALSFIMREGWWTQEQEADLESQQKYLKRLNGDFKVMDIQRERDEIQKLIIPVQQKIAELLEIRAKYMPQTAESFANKRINELHITKFLYKDPDLTNLLFDEDEFYLLDSKISYLLQLEYFSLIDNFNYENIQKLASSVMFQNFLYVGGETINDFFGVPVTKASRYQFELFISGQNFKNIIKNCATMDREIPENLYGNPKGLNDFYQSVKRQWESKNKTNKTNSGNGGSSRVGANADEARKIYGSEANNGGLLSKARQNGGKLDMRNL